ncbi:hypothetical protein [Xanthobacter sediminis]
MAPAPLSPLLGSRAMARIHERNTFLKHAGLIGGLVLAAIISQDWERT